MKVTTKNATSFCLINFSSILQSLLFFSFTLIILGCTAVSDGKNNLDQKDRSDPASGGFVWGQNPEVDKKTGKPIEKELSNDEIIAQQEEILKRQEVEKLRLQREKEDILRQELYNRQLKQMQ